jgi:hypothetical protein
MTKLRYQPSLQNRGLTIATDVLVHNGFSRRNVRRLPSSLLDI